MLVFPIRTDRRLHSTPLVNTALVIVNVAVFVLSQRGVDQGLLGQYHLDPMAPQLWQFVTYQFLHANWMHLAGNMLFLWVFGNSVEDRLGKVGYLGFYLAGGVLAGVGHAALEPVPVIGASGAVAAVTGAYLALFPLSNVTVAYWFLFFLGTFEVSGLVMIGFQIAENVVLQIMGGGGVAYLAHLAGYAYGFALGLLLLWTRLLPREPYDFLAMIDQRRRRAQFAALTRQGYQPWDYNRVGSPPKPGQEQAISPQQQRIMELRSQISQALAARQPEAAAALYAQLLAADPNQVLSQAQQLDVANHLAALGRHELAARAYELFLQANKSYPQREEIELMLALLCLRYLGRRGQAIELLNRALPRLHDERKALAEEMLTQAQA